MTYHDNSIHISLSEDTELGQNYLLIEGEPGQGTVLELQGLRKEGMGSWRNHRGHLGVGRVPGKQHSQGHWGDLQPARPAHGSPWSPRWSDWINHISHALIGADNWWAGFVHRKCVRINLAEWNRKNGDHLISSCAKEGDTKQQCLLWSLAQAKQGDREPVQTAGQWDLPGPDDGQELWDWAQ